MKPNMSVGLHCRLTQPTENGQGIVGKNFFAQFKKGAPSYLP
jgi:hypothetical protein